MGELTKFLSMRLVVLTTIADDEREEVAPGRRQPGR